MSHKRARLIPITVTNPELLETLVKEKSNTEAAKRVRKELKAYREAKKKRQNRTE